jgi:hypothetical protein
MYELIYLVEENFGQFFPIIGGTLPKKKWKFFSQQGMTIHTPTESICRV